MSKNPFVRLRELTGLGQREFERKYQLSHTVMVSIEAGIYPDLSNYMIESLGREAHEKGLSAGPILQDEYGVGTLQEAYHAWQTEQRKIARPMFRQVDLGEIERRVTPELSPMHFFIKGVTGSLRSFCTTLKVPTATVTRYVTGKTRTMPKALESALNEAGMPASLLRGLQTSQKDWTDKWA